MFHHTLVALVVAVAVTPPVVGCLRWQMNRVFRSQMATMIRGLPDRAHAAEMGERAGRVPTLKLKPDERCRVAMNAARAEIARSVADDGADGLVAATDHLRSVLTDPPDDWQLSFQAAEDLVAAMSVKANKHGDFAGYEEALDLLASFCDAPDADASAFVVGCFRLAEYLMTSARRATTLDGLDILAQAAVEALDGAIEESTRTRRVMLPGLHALRAECLGMLAHNPEDLDRAIDAARHARRLARWRPRARSSNDLVLASLLIVRASWVVDSIEAVPFGADAIRATSGRGALHDLRTAHELLPSADRFGDLDRRLGVLEQRANLLAVQTLLTGKTSDPDAAEAWRRVARHASHTPIARVFDTATSWVSWAERTGIPDLCAEAYQHLLSLIPRAVAARYLATERDRLLFDVQECAEEAGYWLVTTNRLADAAVALELGRAASISGVVRRDRPGLAATLTGAGRPDLLARYEDAARELAAAERAGPTDAEELSSRLQRARADHDAVLREASLVEGSAHLVERVCVDDVVAAARTGPLVYLAAADRLGYAVVVTAAGVESWLPLPALTRERVAEQARQLLLEPGHERLAVPATLHWLWENGIRDLAASLAPDAPVTLVPVGLLTLLPVHAAGGPAADGEPPARWQHLVDTVPVRYAPNARTLARSEAYADLLRHTQLTVLAVDAPGGGPLGSLPHTRREVDELGRRWGATGGVARALHSASREQVWPELELHSVWHFACHCVAGLDDVLDSALIVEDGTVSLAELLTVPAAPRRLAVLSACQSHRSSVDLPNEAMGLPGGLMQIGFAGIVASHWRVDDVSAVFLMAKFYDHWRIGGVDPWAALAAAQHWLRLATNTELEEYIPGMLPAPPAGSTVSHEDRARCRPFSHPYHWASFALSGA